MQELTLAQLRKLVDETHHLPGETKLVTGAKHGTYVQLRSIKPTQVLVFHSTRRPLGMSLHPVLPPEEFGCRSQSELAEQAVIETTLEVVI